jgi:hypothetical protein
MFERACAREVDELRCPPNVALIDSSECRRDRPAKHLEDDIDGLLSGVRICRKLLGEVRYEGYNRMLWMTSARRKAAYLPG